MDYKYKSNEQNVCPKCGSDMLEYDASECEGDMIYYPWKCEHCGAAGEEWYNLEFAGHNIEEDEGMIEIQEDMLEKKTVKSEQPVQDAVPSPSGAEKLDKEKNTVTLVNALCKHDIVVPAGSYGKTYHAMVFTSAAGNDYTWVTSTFPSYAVGKTYNIKAKLVPGRINQMQYVKDIGQAEVARLQMEAKSEQPDKKIRDAYEIIYGHTLDF